MTETVRKPRADKNGDQTPTANLFMHGRSQAVRLPKEFRFKGEEVRLSRVGDKVILEPIEKPPFNVKAWRERLRAMSSITRHSSSVRSLW